MSVINDALKKASKEKKEVFPQPPNVSPSTGQGPENPAGRRPKGSVTNYGSPAGFRPTPAKPNRLEKWIMALFFGVVILLVSTGLFLAREFFFKTKKPVVSLPAVVRDKPVQEETVSREPGRDVHIPDKIVPPEVMPAETVKEIPKEEDFGEVPEFSLTGIVFGGGEPSAIINDKIVKEGDMIEEAKVLKIKSKEVMLDFKGKEISLFY